MATFGLTLHTYSLTYSHIHSRAHALTHLLRTGGCSLATYCARRTETTMTLPGLSMGTSQLLTW